MVQTRGMADQRIEEATEQAGKAKDTSPSVRPPTVCDCSTTLTTIQNPSTLSSGGAVGKQFNRKRSYVNVK